MPAATGGGSRVVGVTKDLGKTWEKHPTSRTAQLREPVCQGSILAVDAVPGAGRTGSVFQSEYDIGPFPYDAQGLCG